ncbi:hypothetical protein EU538_07730 [Candidatus Thorarchaeota archaeon]|jgi:hypothetical protein|nr:MAG: hypothetical protein EU538_07730 [Candidatus Thorarchaeota archaeon]
MPTYNLGTLTITEHDAEKLTIALGIPENRFEQLVEMARSAWAFEDTISERIEWLAERLSGSELVFALVFLGRYWGGTSAED